MVNAGSAAVRASIAGTFSALLVVGLAAGAAWAAGPLETVREAIDRALAVLNDPAPADDMKRERLVREVSPYLDYAETARRTLGPHRPKSEDERAEFEGLFTRLLKERYLTGVFFAKAKGARVVYLKETVGGELARVPAKIITAEGTAIPVTLSLHLVGGQWRVYDWNAEGVSLVANYRAQFSRMLANRSFAEFLAELRAKLGQTEARR